MVRRYEFPIPPSLSGHASDLRPFNRPDWTCRTLSIEVHESNGIAEHLSRLIHDVLIDMPRGPAALLLGREAWLRLGIEMAQFIKWRVKDPEGSEYRPPDYTPVDEFRGVPIMVDNSRGWYAQALVHRTLLGNTKRYVWEGPA